MKLNDFFTKSPKAKASSRKIVTVVNDRREQELRGEMQELTKSLSRLEIVEKENVTLNDRAQNAETHLKEILEREDVALVSKNLMILVALKFDQLKFAIWEFKGRYYRSNLNWKIVDKDIVV